MSGQPGQRSGGANRRSASEHRLNGTWRRDRHATNAQVPPATERAPEGDVGATAMPPAGLSASSRRIWARILAEYDISDAPQLELLESALRSRDIAEEARKTLEHDGLTFTDKHGQPRAHPAAAIHRDARAAYVSTLRVLGFPTEE